MEFFNCTVESRWTERRSSNVCFSLCYLGLTKRKLQGGQRTWQKSWELILLTPDEADWDFTECPNHSNEDFLCETKQIETRQQTAGSTNKSENQNYQITRFNQLFSIDMTIERHTEKEIKNENNFPLLHLYNASWNHEVTMSNR